MKAANKMYKRFSSILQSVTWSFSNTIDIWTPFSFSYYAPYNQIYFFFIILNKLKKRVVIKGRDFLTVEFTYWWYYNLKWKEDGRLIIMFKLIEWKLINRFYLLIVKKSVKSKWDLNRNFCFSFFLLAVWKKNEILFLIKQYNFFKLCFVFFNLFNFMF